MTSLTGPQREMTTEEWAQELGCHPETLRRAIRRRQLLAHKRPLSVGPVYVISAADMASFLEKRRNR